LLLIVPLDNHTIGVVYVNNVTMVSNNLDAIAVAKGLFADYFEPGLLDAPLDLGEAPDYSLHCVTSRFSRQRQAIPLGAQVLRPVCLFVLFRLKRRATINRPSEAPQARQQCQQRH
jgi:hypothetical protein